MGPFSQDFLGGGQLKAQAEKAAAPIDIASKEAAAEKARQAARQNVETNKDIQRFDPFQPSGLFAGVVSCFSILRWFHIADTPSSHGPLSLVSSLPSCRRGLSPFPVSCQQQCSVTEGPPG